MAGFMYQGLCHMRQQDAIDNHFQHLPPSTIVSSGTTYTIFHNKNTTGTWSLVKQSITNTGVITTNHNVVVPSPNFATCDDSVGANDLLSLTAAQGALIGGSIILVWAIAFSVRAIISTLNFNEDRNENE